MMKTSSNDDRPLAPRRTKQGQVKKGELGRITEDTTEEGITEDATPPGTVSHSKAILMRP